MNSPRSMYSGESPRLRNPLVHRAPRFRLSPPAHPGRPQRANLRSSRSSGRRKRAEGGFFFFFKRTRQANRVEPQAPPPLSSRRRKSGRPSSCSAIRGKQAEGAGGREAEEELIQSVSPFKSDEAWRSILKAHIARKPMIFLSYAYQTVYDYRNRGLFLPRTLLI